MKKSSLVISAGGAFRFCSRLRIQHRRGRFHRKRNTRNADPDTVSHTGSDAYSGSDSHTGAGGVSDSPWS